jgi:hypothetical protein
LQPLAAGGTAFLVLWAIYRFEVGRVSGLPIPLPAASHLLPLLKLQEHMREGHSAFLMGQNYHHGLWYYFPVAFALKTPPLTLALLLVTAAGLALRRLPSSGWRDEAALLLAPLVYFGVSLGSGINIGYRHLLPILPFLFVFASRIANCELRIADRKSQIADRKSQIADRITDYATRNTQHVLRFTLYAALTLYALVTLTLFPWYLAYFNLFAGGPDGGYRYLVDSNLDWGQTWKGLRRYLGEEHIVAFGLSQYTINDPHAYGLDYTPLPPWPDAPPVLPRRFDPAPGVYAISTTTLQGVVVADPEMFDYFRKTEPVARIGHAMFVYRVEPHPQADWAAQCSAPVVPLPPDVLAEGLGRSDLRQTTFDCTQGWLYPAGSGWYVLDRDVQSQGAAYLADGRLAYEQTRPGFTPPFAVYEWFGADPLAGLPPAEVWAAPGDWPPAQAAAEGVPLRPPVAVGDGLEFLGYTVEEGAVLAYWRVTQTPQQPFSLLAHLLDENGVPVAVGDGLDVPYEQLVPGDVIVQRHVLAAPPGTYWLEVGAYTLPDVQRLPVLWGDDVAGDRLVVGQLETLRVLDP